MVRLTVTINISDEAQNVEATKPMCIERTLPPVKYGNSKRLRDCRLSFNMPTAYR